MNAKPTFLAGHAAATSWQDAVQSCVAQIGQGTSAEVGFIYLTDSLAEDADSIFRYLQTNLAVRHWTGTVGMGVSASGTEYFDQPAISVLLGDLPDGSCMLLPENIESGNSDSPLRCENNVAHFAIVHGDSNYEALPALIERTAHRVASGFVVGGLASSRTGNLQIRNGIHHGSLSGLLLDESVEVLTRLTQGCIPIGPRHEVTDCRRNIIMALDDRPALDVFREDIGEPLASNLNRVGGHIFAGLPIAGSDTGDYLVRNLVGVDPSNKLIAVGEMLAAGRRIMFCRRDRDAACTDMQRMLNEIGRASCRERV